MRASQVVLAVLVLASTGWGPGAGCAKGCSAACRSGSKVSSRSYVPELARATPGIGARRSVGVGAGAYVDDVYVPGIGAHVDDGIRASGAAIPRSTTPGFARDYGRAIEQVGATPQQHQRIVDALEHAQDLLVELAKTAADDPDAARAARRQAAAELEARLAAALRPEQLEHLKDLLGTSDVILERLAAEQPVERN